MQLTIPDYYLGEFCPGIHVEGHRKKEDGSYYSTDSRENNSYHYHNIDGSVFYRYSDGSKYYRHKNGNIQFSPPAEPHEKAEGADTTVSRLRYDWPPQLDLSIKTDGTFAIIRDASGSMVAFEPVGANAGAGLAPVHDRSTSSGQAHLDGDRSQVSQDATFRAQEWVRKQALEDILSREEKGPQETGNLMVSA